MRIVVLCKFAPDPEDVEVESDGSLNLSRAEWKISEYDLQAIEAGVRLAAETKGTVDVLSAGPARIDDTRLKKDLLSRGPDQLHLLIDESLAEADTAVVSEVLAAGVRKIGADVVVCGEGSADRYFQQTGGQVGERLAWATTNAVNAITATDDSLRVERLLEGEIEVLELPLPAVLSVTTYINSPPLPSMKAILTAGKKPTTVLSLSDVGLATSPTARTQVVDTAAPPSPDRKRVILSGTSEENVEDLIKHLKQEGAL